ncbi:2-succinyl-5-enolpyruvyl-6-hydroxy-3-cyclohexene-1-carboxylate synthase [Coriobacteriaceae bacterium CHKCI002]|nr:2-succinyl-5-enolpyruvyl-6-hydroxy-3-cyclohexene-1-carboxylate synthase [Coriobacteriaceae bacterium CHKCI002]
MSAAGECVDACAGGMGGHAGASGASERVGAPASGAGQGTGASADGADRGASENAAALAGGAADPRATARFVGAFLDELCRWGVRDVVVSPGSRSTPLAMCAYELSRRAPERLRLFVDVDERGAAFFALGLAKAGGCPAALICTSGTAVANYYPAVLEAESSRVPLIVLTGDRPPRLQGLGAPQTCDQLKAYGDHVHAFRQMPLPSADAASLAFARQAAREACAAAGGDVGVGEAAAAAVCADGCGVTARIAGCCAGGPVHLNFPFDEPLKPDLSTTGLFDGGRKRVVCAGVAARAEAAVCAGAAVRPEAAVRADTAAGAEVADDAAAARIGAADVSRETPVLLPGVAPVRATMTSEAARAVSGLLVDARALVLAGEGTCSTVEEARAVLAWAHAFGLPLLADPLSGLRSFDEPFVIDNYDSVLGAGGAAPEGLHPQVIVRFGCYPVSKRATQFVAATRPVQIVVDERETRDFNAATDVFVPCRPIEFARAMMGARTEGEAEASLSPSSSRQEFLAAWVAANEQARARIVAAACNDAGDGAVGATGTGVPEATATFEGAYVRRVVELAPEGSCLFAANSMSIRALDTFLLKSDKRLAVLCNRGLNGIDGTVSTALGAAQRFAQTTLITGDLTLLHDLNALALQRELRVQRAHGAKAGLSAAAASGAPYGNGTGEGFARDEARGAEGGFACDEARDAGEVALGGAPIGMEGWPVPSIVIVLLNNDGGGIFDMLPQRSDEAYFERLFLTPQEVDFQAASRAFSVPYCRAETVAAFDKAYRAALGVPGISLIEVRVPLRGLKERYAPCW